MSQNQRKIAANCKKRKLIRAFNAKALKIKTRKFSADLAALFIHCARCESKVNIVVSSYKLDVIIQKLAKPVWKQIRISDLRCP